MTEIQLFDPVEVARRERDDLVKALRALLDAQPRCYLCRLEGARPGPPATLRDSANDVLVCGGHPTAVVNAQPLRTAPAIYAAQVALRKAER